MSAIASEAFEVAHEAAASANAQRKPTIEEASAAGHERITSSKQRGKKPLKPSDPEEDRLLKKHRRSVSAINNANTLQDVIRLGKISALQLLETTLNQEADFDMTKARQIAESNAHDHYDKDKEAHQKIMDDLCTSAETNYKLVTDGQCDPFHETPQEHQAAPAGHGSLKELITAVQNDQDVKRWFQAISQNMNKIKESLLVHKARTTVLQNLAMIQLALLALRYREIHKESDQDMTMHAGLFKLAKEAGFKQATSEKYFKALVYASEAYLKLQNTFHMLKYATISIGTWKDNHRTIMADLYGQGEKNVQWRAMLVKTNKDENDVAQRRIDDFLNKPK